MKRIYTIFAFMLAVVASLVATSCKDDAGLKVDALPYRSKEDGQWKMIKTNGEMLEGTGFENTPTKATCDRYWVKNRKGYWELYSTDKNAPVADVEYRYVSLFQKDRAIVTQRDENVTVIDKNGETITDLSKIANYRPDQFTGFNGDVAIFTVDNKMGVCNYKGELLISPVYSVIGTPTDGKIVATDSIAFNNMVMQDSVSGPRGNVIVFDYKGEQLLKLPRKKYIQVADKFSGDYLAVAEERKGAEEEGLYNWGIINVKGEEVVKCSRKYSFIGEIKDDMFTYYDGEYWGVSTFKGDKILPAKYTYITISGDYILASKGRPEDSDDDVENSEMRLYDKKGEAVLAKKFLDIKIYDKTLFVKVDIDRWNVLNMKGEKKEDAPKIYQLADYSEGDLYISTDKINITGFVKALDFTDSTMDGLTFSSSVQNVLKRQAETYSSTNTPKAADYNNTSEVSIYRRIDGCSVTETVNFPGKLSHQTYREQVVIDYWWDYDYYYHINKIPTGYAFTSQKPSWFSMTFDNYGILRGKLKSLYNALCNKFAGMGSEEERTSSAAVYRLSNGRYAIVYLESHSVTAKWGSLSASERNVYNYAGNKEDLAYDEDEMED